MYLRRSCIGVWHEYCVMVAAGRGVPPSPDWGWFQEVKIMNRRHRWSIATLLMIATLLQGCAAVTGAAVGGAVGYRLHEQGYQFRSPVTH
jgi:hypothetical protein